MINFAEYLLNEYAPFDELEQLDLKKFREFFTEYQNHIYDRVPNQPVITASAIVVNPDFTKILIMHHKLHNFYKQFGGHADGESDLAKVAATELFEESGATGKLLSHVPFDLIRWNFPEMTKNNLFFTEHDCFDIAFIFMMDESEKLFPNKNEVLDTKWELLEKWRDYSDAKNPVYKQNPQNFDYQQRIYKKLKLFSKSKQFV